MHLKQIKAALGISGIIANAFAWHVATTDNTPGAQIDLLIDRADKVVSICEMKYSLGKYTLTKKEAENISTRIEAFRQRQSSNKGIQLVMITNHGMANAPLHLNIHRQLTASDLFR